MELRSWSIVLGVAERDHGLYLSQGVDYLGFLNAKLRDLEGWSTLANELIQNADDAAGSTRIDLDVTNSALIVFTTPSSRTAVPSPRQAALGAP